MKNQTPMGKLIDKVDHVLGWLVEVKHVLQQVDNLQGKMVEVLIKLVNMNNPEIDKLFDSYGLVISENNKQIFPRLEPYPHSVVFKN